jgi:hypothetical protein
MMANSEIFFTLGPIQRLYWWLFGGQTINVKWPSGWVVLHEDPYGGVVSTDSADPNDHYRPWLEKNVGKQGRDWDWQVGAIAADNGQGTIGVDMLNLIFRKGKEDLATIAKLRWG